MPRDSLSVFLAVVVLTTACSASGPSSQPKNGDAVNRGPAGDQSRALVMVARAEPRFLSMKPVISVAGIGDNDVLRSFNAGLVLVDDSDALRPGLAESVPQLDTDSWRVFPDGRMETTFRLKPNLIWHDQSPLLAEDFVFSWRVYGNPDLGQSATPPLVHVEEIVAPDPRTVLIRWKRPFPDATRLEAQDFPALPRHLLAEAFQRDQAEIFSSLPYWASEYVGLGPYRLDRWEAGAFLEGEAFSGHALGRPKIDRIRVRFIGDSNAVLANVLAGEAHYTFTNAIFLQQGSVLKREWASSSQGVVLVIPSQWRRVEIQHRPEYANSRAILDPRVRRAMAHAVDRSALNDAVFDGEGVLAESMIPPWVDYAADLQRSVVGYPFDLRRTESLMAEAGFRPAADGVWTSPVDGRLSGEIRASNTADFVAELSIMAAGFRQARFDVQEVPMPLRSRSDRLSRHTFAFMDIGGGGMGESGAVPNFTAADIGTPENLWTGRNRGGWASSEYDRLFNAFSTTLDRSERNRQIVQMMRVFSEEVGAISLYFNPIVIAHVAALKGPRNYGAESVATWNIYEWEWRT